MSGGGKGGGGGKAHTPYEAPNTLHSKQIYKTLDIISEGEIEGFVNGNDYPFKSVFYDDTPVQNADGSFNFSGIKALAVRGTFDQPYLPGFAATEKTVSVGVEVLQAVPITRSVTDSLVTRVRVTLGVQSLVHIKENGDQVPTNVQMKAEITKNGTVVSRKYFDLTEKGNAPFYQDLVFDNLPDAPYNILVTRLTADSQDSKTQNKTFFSSFVEIIDAKLTYPNTAMVGTVIDMAQTGGKNPKRNYLIRGRKVQVPTTYDPFARTYSSGLWDGSFKEAWTNNPAWIYYDIVNEDRFGMGEKIKPFQMDRFSMYTIAKFCDELVDDGMGGKEPRATFNAWLTDRRSAYEVLSDLASVFFGMSVWDGRMFRATVDMPSDPVWTYTNANVVNGEFNYEYVSRKAIFTAVHVQYTDKFDGYRPKIEYVSDDEMIKRYGLNVQRINAFGCTSRGQAVRSAKHILATSKLEPMVVSFIVGPEGLRHIPSDIIAVADNNYAGAMIGGRVQSVKGDVVTLDRDVDKVVGQSFSYADDEMNMVTATIKSQPKPNQLKLDKVPSGLGANDVYSVNRSDVKPQLYRALGIAENEDGTYTINAVVHVPEKMAIVADGIHFERDKTTLWDDIPELINGTVGNDGDDIILTWDNLTTPSGVLTYEIKLYKDGKIYKTWTDLTEPVFRFEGLPKGNYVAEIRAKNARGQYSNALTKAFNLNYTVTNLIATSKIFAIGLTWKLPDILNDNVWSEVWYSKTNSIEEARLLVSLPKPLNNFVLDNLSLDQSYYFWVRLSNQNGITGEFTQSVFGEPEQGAEKILEHLEGKITETELGSGLVESITGNAASEAIGKVKEDIDEILKESDTLLEITTDVENAHANLKLLTQSGISGDQVLSGQTLLVNAKTDLTSAQVLLQHLAQASTDRARSAQYLALNAQFGDVVASFTRLEEVVATETQAMAQAIEELKAQVGEDLQASITEMKQVIADLDGTVKAMVTIKAETMSNGKKVVAGLSFGVDGEESQFIIMANKFAITSQDGEVTRTPFMVITEGGVTTVAIDGSLIADGTILGQHIKANQIISAPLIKGGSMNLGDGQFTVDANGKMIAQNAEIVGKITANSGVFRGRLEATDGYFEGTVFAKKIEGDVVRVIYLQKTAGLGAIYQITIPPSEFDRTLSIPNFFAGFHKDYSGLLANWTVFVQLNGVTKYTSSSQDGGRVGQAKRFPPRLLDGIVIEIPKGQSNNVIRFRTNERYGSYWEEGDNMTTTNLQVAFLTLKQ